MENYVLNTESGEVVSVWFEQERWSSNWIKGFVYPVVTNQNGTVMYRGEEHCDYSEEYHPEKNNCECMFEWSFCWRGVWEGRIYPKQEEYWSEELREMADIWELIEADMKKKIKEWNPEYKHFDE